MTGRAVVPTLAAPAAENQPLGQFQGASSESRARLTLLLDHTGSPMHETAHDVGRAFFGTSSISSQRVILAVGSQDINGSLRTGAPPCATYIGVDIMTG